MILARLLQIFINRHLLKWNLLRSDNALHEHLMIGWISSTSHRFNCSLLTAVGSILMLHLQSSKTDGFADRGRGGMII